MDYYRIDKTDWDSRLAELTSVYNIYAPCRNEKRPDYEFITRDLIPEIVYNNPGPLTPLKTFFLPVKENVTAEKPVSKPRIIMGIPNCDTEGLKLVDEIYIDRDYPDENYRSRRENTLLFATDCLSIRENCHCTACGIKPWVGDSADLSVSGIDGYIILGAISTNGKKFAESLNPVAIDESEASVKWLHEQHSRIEKSLAANIDMLPGNEESGRLIEKSDRDIWIKYSSDCVSCGACSAICPTCTCFLLIDKPGFEKVKQLDTCQYPGFERVAGGEDPLIEIADRFRNRYMCKYVWRKRKFSHPACTGCGRCIDACPGQISKNELIRELNAAVNA